MLHSLTQQHNSLIYLVNLWNTELNHSIWCTLRHNCDTWLSSRKSIYQISNRYFSYLSFSAGSEECPFLYPTDDSKDWSPDPAVTSRLRPTRVHSYTQTEGPQLSSPITEVTIFQPSLLVPAPPTLSSCPSPLLHIKRHCAKWENKASVLQKPKAQEENKATYESLELVSSMFSATQTMNDPHLLYFNQSNVFCFVFVFFRKTRGSKKPMRHYVGNWEWQRRRLIS